MLKPLIYLIVIAIFFCSCRKQKNYSTLISEYSDQDTIQECIKYFANNIVNHCGSHYVNDIAFRCYMSEFSTTFKQPYEHRKEVLKRLINSPKLTDLKQVNIIKDVDIINDSFLINHIKKSIESWCNPWSKHLSFEEFKMFILPYRVYNESFENIETTINTYFPWVVNLKKDSLTALEACGMINDSIKAKVNYMSEFDKLPTLSVSQTLQLGGGNCIALTNLATLVMRYAGLPVASVCNREGHFANVLSLEDGRLVHFQGGEKKVKIRKKVDSGVTSKIFLRTYHYNEDLIKLIKKEELNNIPSKLQDIFCIDISNNLLPSPNIKIKCKNTINNDIYYLCSNNQLNGNNWIPIDYAISKSNQVVFKNVGINNVYIVQQIKNGEKHYVSNPFYLESDSSIRYFYPDTTKRITIDARRKCKMLMSGSRFSNQLKGCSFHASNTPIFEQYDSLFSISKKSSFYEKYSVECTTPFKYYRIFSPRKNINIAELKFIDKNNQPIAGIPFSSSNILDAEHAFDNNISTYAQGIGEGSWIGITCKRPTELSAFQILFRNNLNVIENGIDYELYRWKNNDWQYLDSQIGKKERVLFENIPSNALYQIRSSEGGEQNMAFWIENGEQSWARKLYY